MHSDVLSFIPQPQTDHHPGRRFLQRVDPKRNLNHAQLLQTAAKKTRCSDAGDGVRFNDGMGKKSDAPGTTMFSQWGAYLGAFDFEHKRHLLGASRRRLEI